MPIQDLFESHSPLGLIRHWIEASFCCDQDKFSFQYFYQILIIETMVLLGGRCQSVSTRLQLKFILTTIATQTEEQLKRINSILLSSHLESFSEEIQNMADTFTSSTFDIFQAAQKQFLLIPKKLHYIFNPRDVNRIFKVF
jgi:hypothetical protein